MFWRDDAMGTRRVSGVPLWTILFAAATSLAILAYRAEADPGLRPWHVLALWVASRVVFPASAHAFGRGEARRETATMDKWIYPRDDIAAMVKTHIGHVPS